MNKESTDVFSKLPELIKSAVMDAVGSSHMAIAKVQSNGQGELLARMTSIENGLNKHVEWEEKDHKMIFDKLNEISPIVRAINEKKMVEKFDDLTPVLERFKEEKYFYSVTSRKLGSLKEIVSAIFPIFAIIYFFKWLLGLDIPEWLVNHL